MHPRWLPVCMALLVAAPATVMADISVPFRELVERRAADGIVHEPRWSDVRANPDEYRGKTIDYLLRVAGRIDARGESQLICYSRDKESIEVLCPGGCRVAEPGGWVAVLGRIPDEGPVTVLIGIAVARIAPPGRRRGSAVNQGAITGGEGEGETTGGSNAAGNLSGDAGDSGDEDPGGQAAGSNGVKPMDPSEVAETPPGGTRPLSPDELARRSRQPAVPPGYDGAALARLERFISSRNPNIRPAERRLIATEVLRLSQLYRMRWEFFAAMLAAESDFDRFCVSSAGAMGLGQLMPANCIEYGVRDPFDIRDNLRGSAQHISEFLVKYQGRDPTDQFQLALACYNAGPGAVAKYGGVPPYRETVNYIVKIARLYVRLCEESAAASR